MVLSKKITLLGSKEWTIQGPEYNQVATAIIQMKDNDNSNWGGCNGKPKQVSNLEHILEVRPWRPADNL